MLGYPQRTNIGIIKIHASIQLRLPAPDFRRNIKIHSISICSRYGGHGKQQHPRMGFIIIRFEEPRI